MKLKNKADGSIAKRRELLVVKIKNRRAIDQHRAFGRTVERAQQMKQRALAHAGLPDDGDDLSGVHGQIDAAQNFQRAVCRRIAFAQLPCYEYRFLFRHIDPQSIRNEWRAQDLASRRARQDKVWQ